MRRATLQLLAQLPEQVLAGLSTVIQQPHSAALRAQGAAHLPLLLQFSRDLPVLARHASIQHRCCTGIMSHALSRDEQPEAARMSLNVQCLTRHMLMRIAFADASLTLPSGWSPDLLFACRQACIEYLPVHKPSL